MDDFTAAGSRFPGSWLRRGRCWAAAGAPTVWLVTDERSRPRVCAEVPRCRAQRRDRSPAKAAKPGRAEEAIRREIRILSVLDHEHLSKPTTSSVFASLPDQRCRTEGALGLLLDYAPGGSLGELVGSRAKLTIGGDGDRADPHCPGTRLPARHGFTHGDVSPGQRVLYRPRQTNAVRRRRSADGGRCPGQPADHGTEGFMDPAPVDAVRAGLQPERDVYSLAALGWYCLTGQPPLPGRRPSASVAPGARRTGRTGRGPGGRTRRGPAATAHGRRIGHRGLSQHGGGAGGPFCHCPSERGTAITHPAQTAPERPGAAGRTVPRVAAPALREPRALAGTCCQPRDRSPTPALSPTLAPPPARDVRPDTGRASGSAAAEEALAAPPGAHARTSPASIARHAATGATARHSAAGQSTGPNAGLNTEHTTTVPRVREDARRETGPGTRPEAWPPIRHGGTFASGRRRGRRKRWAGAAAAVMLLAGLCAAWLHPGAGIAELFAASAPPTAAPTNPSMPAAAGIPRELLELLESTDPA